MKLRQAIPILSNNATFFPYGWCEYKVLQNREDFPRRSHYIPDSKKGQNKHKHSLSKGACKKVRNALNMLVYIADDKPIFPDNKDCKIFFKVNTCMMSLPSRQVHTDEQIKKLILDPFLKACKYHFGLTNYFWKSEAQDNGNIHFHLETDCYMEVNKFRSLWNHQLDRYGYIQAYRENQIEKHKSGFYYNKEQYKINFKTKEKTKISYIDQKKSYEKGMVNNWSDPNTCTVRSIINVNNLAAYLVTYLSKKDLWKKSISSEDKKAIARMEKEGIELEVIQKKFPHCVKRSISGKIWDCSSKLKNTGLKIENVDRFANELEYMKDNEVERILYHDNCTIYIKREEFQKMYPPALAELISDHYHLIKYDCCSINHHKILLENEKTLQELLIASHCSSTTENQMSNIQRLKRLQTPRRCKRPSKQHRQTTLQFRL